jgi:hypothetical protein
MELLVQPPGLVTIDKKDKGGLCLCRNCQLYVNNNKKRYRESVMELRCGRWLVGDCVIDLL